MASARDVAALLLQLSSREEEPTLITQMHLHKLMYYVQAWSLAMRGDPMFPDRIEAWTHGPVVRSVYPVYADFKNRPIEVAERSVSLSPEDQAFVESIWEGYKGYSAAKLREMTHRESPWLRARGDAAPDSHCDTEISPDEMRHFFRSQYDQNRFLEFDRMRLESAAEDLAAGRGVPLEDVIAG